MICFRTCVVNTQNPSLCAGRQEELDQENFVLDTGKIVFYSTGKAIHNIPEKKRTPSIHISKIKKALRK